MLYPYAGRHPASHSVLICDDGEAIAFGDNKYGQCNVPTLPSGKRYSSVVAGGVHTILIRDDGEAIALAGIYPASAMCPLSQQATDTAVRLLGVVAAY